jgi:hypothetical protein
MNGWNQLNENKMKVSLFLAISLAALAIGLTFASRIVADRYGQEVADRFLERRKFYDRTYLRDWVSANPGAARGYAFPVLFPLDLLFMVSLGAFLAIGSVIAAETVEALRNFAWLFAVVPVTYVVLDLVEDVLLACFLTWPGETL